MRQCKSTKLLKKTILLQFLVEPGQSSLVCQLPVINQTLCIVQMLENWHVTNTIFCPWLQHQP